MAQLTPTIIDQQSGENWTAIHGDCVEALRDIPENSVGLSVFSPPFSSLYIYSQSERDMGNVDDDEQFQASYRHVCEQLYRVTKPGRLCAIHVKDLVYYSNSSDKGDRGIRDFTGECIRTHQAAGWTYHTRITIWRCPVREMQKTKPDGLLFRNFRLDAARVRVGMPEYLILFRKWADGEQAPPVVHDPAQFPLETWQEWASPVWMDTDQMDVLNVRTARSDEAERHLCPMPLDLSARAIQLWSNPGDVVLTPFMGIGSEVVAALRHGRKAIGIELNPNYYAQAVKYAREAEANARTLFDGVPG
jgi:DNA modification methylase